jgi:DNA repair exonuclease SbcCD ATPase subunit
MQISQLELNNFGKHSHKLINFLTGSNLIIGPNYSGKSTIMRAIGISLYGNRMTPIPTKLLVRKGAKDFHLKLTIAAAPVNLIVERTSVNSSITREGEGSPYVVGHTQVNEEITRLVQMSRDTFRKVFMSEQGSPQQLLAMEGAELQRFVESVTELDDLDAMQKLAGQKAVKAKTQAETLESLMLSDGDYTTKKELVTQLVAQLESGLKEQAIVEESHAMVKCELENLQAEVGKAIDVNRAAEKWYAGKEAVKNQIAARPEQELVDTSDLEVQADQLKSKVSLLEQEIKSDRALCQQWAIYSSELASLTAGNAELASKNLSLIDESEIALCRVSISSLESDIAGAKVLNEKWVAASQQLEKTSAELASAKAALQSHGAEKIVPDIAVEERVYEELSAQCLTMSNDKANIQKVLEESECPTCKRPWDEHFDREAKEQEFESLVVKLKTLLSDRAAALVELDNAKRNRETCQAHNAKYNSLHSHVVYCELKLAEADDAIKQLKPKVPEDQLAEWSSFLQEHKVNLEKYLKHNSDTAMELARLRKYEEQLAALVEPSTPKPTDVEVDAKAMLLSSTRESLAKCSSVLTELTTKNTMAQASNSVRVTLLNKLKDYPDALDPKVVDVKPLLDKSAALSSQVDTFGNALRNIVATNTSIKLDLQPLQSEVANHESYISKRAEALEQAKLSSYLGNLISTHREAFMAKAQSTLFEVASEFARLSSDGDIQEILVHDGSISYKENDQVFPKDTASGSQKSMMGLGMKLGIANLINSDFDTFLLDEVSADMSEDISLKCMGALDMLCANSITITHRPMDVAGNVISLGA